MNRYKTDGPKVTGDEAVELCIHHLQLAAMFFMNTPGANTEALLFEELNRRVERDLNYPGLGAFITAICASYEADRARDEA